MSVYDLLEREIGVRVTPDFSLLSFGERNWTKGNTMSVYNLLER